MLESLKAAMERYGWVVDQDRLLKDGYYMLNSDGTERFLISNDVSMKRKVAEKLGVDEDDL